jgi:predicted lipoprotein with Yx(FWY)xxD motif
LTCWGSFRFGAASCWFDGLPSPKQEIAVRRPYLISAAALAALVLAAAGCGSSSNSSSSTNAGAAAGGSAYGGGGGGGSTTSTSAAMVKTAKTPLGVILVDGSGRSLYIFRSDTGTTSTCSGACAAAWPPLTTKGDPTAGGAAAAAKLGTTRRSDGSVEVLYAGHPLYYYAGDSAPGDTTGQNLDQFGAEWYVVAPSGHWIDEGS